MTNISPLAGTPATAAQLVDLPRLLAAYADLRPDPAIAAQRVVFGTSGHRGSSLQRSFNEWHMLAISQAVCEYRAQQDTDGPLFLGIDTHALSAPACSSVLEVLAGNGVTALIAAGGEYTPTPAISHAILGYNRGRKSGLADGIVITPSHNPPDNGGIKYNPPNGGPADTGATGVIEARANELLTARLSGVRRVPYAQARAAATTREHDFVGPYVADLENVLDFEVIRASGIHMGVDPLGGAGVHYWPRIAEHYRLNLTVISERVDPTFSFMSLDWDGRIRMDPSSSYAMQPLIAAKDRYDIAFACDTDHDRHGIVTRDDGLLPANHYLSVAIDYLFRNRPRWPAAAAVGKTVVSSSMIDRVTAALGRRLYEVPVGFKWYVEGLIEGQLGFVGEESAGAAFCRFDGGVWTTDKDGLVPALLSAEILARTGRDPGQYYSDLTRTLGAPIASRVEAPATAAQRQRLARLTPDKLSSKQLAGETISAVLDHAPGNQAAIGGIKVIAPSGWFAARPSGTEDIYKIYAESFKSESHLQALLREAQAIVDAALAGA
jgi:phosphoglucomutase